MIPCFQEYIFMHTFTNRDGVTGFNIRNVRRSQFSVQYWTFFGTSIFGYIFLFFEVHRKELQI